MYKTKTSHDSGSGKHFNSFKKKTFHSSGNHSRNFSRGARPIRGGQFKDITKFINKNPLSEKVESYQAINSFANFPLDESLKKNICKAGYNNLTPIQDQSIAYVLEGRDLVGIANTGTGKTAAFVIPLLDKVIKDKKQNILIMAPTRELALQINQEIIRFASGLQIFSVCVVGGLPIYRQIKDLQKNYNFIVGTPGRIKDLTERKRLPLADFQTVVLDESDRMLDMGFINDMRFLISALPVKHQTLFFSATLTTAVKDVIHLFLDNPINVSVKTGDTASGIEQDVIYVKEKTKIELLNDLLIQPEFNKVLIFGRTKVGVERLSNSLSRRGLKVKSIHGNKNHSQRQNALQAFKNNSVNILVATDVAARGLDIPNVSHVINYELPSSYEDYIHRIGRTGRNGKTGKALTFIE